MTNPFKSITDWPFLQEPLYRWALFIVAITMILWAWRAILHRA